MIGLDTNVLLRFLLQDDESQAQRARKVIEGAASHEEPLFINVIVLCEFAWVLGSAYRRTPVEIADALEQILAVEQFEIEERDVVVAVLGEYRAGKADFADCLIGARNRASGCASTVTFDRSAGSLADFKVIR